MTPTNKGMLALALILCLGCTWKIRAAESSTQPSARTVSAPQAADDSWPFQYRDNDFRDTAMLDLRYLNEKTAGEHGFVSLNADGTGFVRGDGVPIRFWGAMYNENHYTAEQLSESARWLAKMGFNTIRRMAHLASVKPGSQPEDVNSSEIDELWRYEAAMKKEGIYTTIVNYSAYMLPSDMTGWGIPGYEVNYIHHRNEDRTAERPWGLMYFNPVLQKGYKVWLKKLYGDVNPYTGISLAKDPALSMITLVTEESLLFYTFDRIKPEQKRELGKLFGDWLKTKYGSLDKALEAWNGETLVKEKQGAISSDDLPNGVMGFYIAHSAKHGLQFSPGKTKRMADQVEFLSRTMQKFYEEIVRYMKEDLGCKQLIQCGNWRPADPVAEQDAERWSYLPGDMMAENHFFYDDLGVEDTFFVAKGHVRANPTALKPLELPDAVPFAFKQVAGHTTFITSTGWVQPNIHQCEAPFLFAAYGGLAGLGGMCWEGFGTHPEYDVIGPKQFKGPNNEPTSSMGTWNFARPSMVSSYLAPALMYRNGYVAQGKPVVEEQRKLQDVWDRKMPLAMDHGSYQAMTEAMKGGSVDPLAFFVGPVWVKYDGDPAKSKVADVSKYILRDQQRVLSNTGQIELNYGKGLCMIDAPKAQGVCGFLDQSKEFTLSTLTITSTNAYASILLVPLDDQPLASSQKVLVQVGTTARPTGWKSEPTLVTVKGRTAPVQAERILDIGTSPWQVAATHATVTVANPHLANATLLDTNGVAAADVPVTLTNGKCQVTLPPQTMYLVLTGH